WSAVRPIAWPLPSRSIIQLVDRRRKFNPVLALIPADVQVRPAHFNQLMVLGSRQGSIPLPARSPARSPGGCRAYHRNDGAAGLRGREQMLHPELPLWLGGAFHGTQGGACTGLMMVA